MMGVKLVLRWWAAAWCEWCSSGRASRCTCTWWLGRRRPGCRCSCSGGCTPSLSCRRTLRLSRNWAAGSCFGLQFQVDCYEILWDSQSLIAISIGSGLLFYCYLICRISENPWSLQKCHRNSLLIESVSTISADWTFPQELTYDVGGLIRCDAGQVSKRWIEMPHPDQLFRYIRQEVPVIL